MKFQGTNVNGMIKRKRELLTQHGLQIQKKDLHSLHLIATDIRGVS